jgi:hypothetical protein
VLKAPKKVDPRFLNTSPPPGYFRDFSCGAWRSLPFPDDPTTDPRTTRSLGYVVIDWAEKNLVHHLSGKPWRFTPSQKRFLVLWYAVDDDGRWVYRRGVRRGAKGPIANTTPVMTPTGWVKHGDLAAGSVVFAEDGTPTRVLEVHPEVDEDCYRIDFSDGSSVVSTGGHRWPMEFLTPHGNYVEKITNAREMAANLTRKDGARLWRQQVAPAVDLPRAELPIDPYVMGAWLGDGSTHDGRMTGIDPEVWNQFERRGYAITHDPRYQRWTAHGLVTQLRELNLLGDKRILAGYLRGSVEQRWELLRGLMDTDGGCDPRNGIAEFTTTSPALRDGVSELLASLGIKFGVRDGRATYYGRDCGPKWRFGFKVYAETPLFYIERKRARQKSPSAGHQGLSLTRRVVAVTPVASVPARCITVAHPSHRYMVGERNIVTCNTGKSPLLAAKLLCELAGPVRFSHFDELGNPIGVPHRMALVQVAANSEAQAKDVLRVANAMVPKKLKAEIKFEPGQTASTAASGRIEVLTSSMSSAEGDPATFIGFDEPHHAKKSNGGHDMAGVVRRNVVKSPGGQARVCEFTNAHEEGEDSVAERTYLAWQDQVAGKTNYQDILYDSTEAPAYLSLHTEADVWAGLRASYADSPWNDLQAIAQEIDMTDTSVADSIRYYFNALAANESSWVDPRRFDDRGRPEIVVADQDEIALFLDCSKSGDATTLSGCRISDGHVISLGGWQKPHGLRGKGWLAPREQVDAKVREAFDRYKVVWFGVDPSPAKDDDTEASYWRPLVDDWHRDFRATLLVWASPQNAVEFDMRLSSPGGRDRNRLFTEAAMQTAVDIDGEVDEFGQVVVAPTLTHDGDSMLRVHVHAARRRPNQWGFTLGKENRDSNRKVDYAVTMVGARLGRRLVLNSAAWQKRAKKRTGRAFLV